MYVFICSTHCTAAQFDYLVIESTGISEPLPVAATFSVADGQGHSLRQVARLDTMVTVVDAVRWEGGRCWPGQWCGWCGVRVGWCGVCLWVVCLDGVGQWVGTLVRC